MSHSLSIMMNYDRDHGIESDARAFVQRNPSDHADENCIVVSPCNGFLDYDDQFYVTPREARCLAAQLLRAAAEAERDDEENE